MKITLLFAATVSIQINILSQVFAKPDYMIEAGTSLSVGRQTPFWLYSNQYGLVTPNKYNGWLKAGVQDNFEEKRKIDYSYGFEIVNRYNNKNELYVHQAYLGMKLYFVNIIAGNIEEKFGNQDSSLTSGGLLWSENCRTMPKVTISVPNYTRIPFTFDLMEFKLGISHGWFGDNEFVYDSWLHHKYAYLRFGGKLPVHIHFGIHHFAQWGGKTDDGQQLPSSFNDFIKVFLGQEGSSDAPDDESNALGNHIGSRQYGIDVDFKNFDIGAYWQTIFEDSSGVEFQNIEDGLWGLSIRTNDKDKLINGFVYEFINTTDQSGPYTEYWLLDGQKYSYEVEGGVKIKEGQDDNYFNNGIYQEGWTYRDMTIGTPFITSPAVLTGNEGSYISNNKVIVHHIGIEGKYKYVVYKVFYSYSLNFGTNRDPINPALSEHSVLIQSYISSLLPWGVDLGLKGGLDIGQMYGNNGGIQISLIKRGSL